MYECPIEDYAITNWFLLQTQIGHKIPEPVVQLVKDYFSQTFHKHPWFYFEGHMPKEIAIEVFLNWLCEYGSAWFYGKKMHNKSSALT